MALSTDVLQGDNLTVVSKRITDTTPEENTSQKILHLKRPARVVILKKVRNIPEPGTDEYSKLVSDGTKLIIPSSDNTRFLQEYDEFIQPLSLAEFNVFRAIPLLTLNKDLTANSEIAIKNSIAPVYKYYQLTLENVAGVPNASFDLVTNPLIGGITSIQIVRDIENGSSATITIKNPLEIFNFKKNIFRQGQCVLDPQDLVMIWLPDIHDRLVLRFSGIVTNVDPKTATHDSLDTTITLFCEDNLKLLKQNRTNVKPSANFLEALQPVSAIENPFANKRPHEILQYMFSQVYCDLNLLDASEYMDLIHGYRLEQLNATSALDFSAAAQKEQDLKNKLLEDSRFITKPLSNEAKLLQEEVNRLQSQTRVDETSAITTADALQSAKSKLEGFFPYKITGSTAPKPPVTTVLAKAFKNFLATDAFSIVGTEQPVYQIIFAKDFNFFISEWQSNYAVAKDVVKRCFFELYTSPSGTIIVRPVNPNLPSDLQNVDLYSVKSDDPNSDQVYKDDGRPSTIYKINRSLVVEENFSDNDRDIVNILYTRGDVAYSELGPIPFAIGAVCDAKAIKKYGVRVAPQQNVFNILDPNALREYGKAILDRINSQRLSGTLIMKGDARLDIGNFCYVKWRSSCYYISSITDNYVPGKAYDQIVQLTYGRRPIAMTYSKGMAESSRALSQGYTELASYLVNKVFDIVIQNMKQSGQIDFVTKLPTDDKTELERLQDGAEYATLAEIKATRKQKLANPEGMRLILDGFVWEDFTDLIYSMAAEVENQSQQDNVEKMIIQESILISKPTVINV